MKIGYVVYGVTAIWSGYFDPFLKFLDLLLYVILPYVGGEISIPFSNVHVRHPFL